MHGGLLAQCGSILAGITGINDIDADWEDYLRLMDKIGIEEFLDILQRNYDHYLAGLK